MDDLKTIKKNYGEKMMHLCRELFPTLLEQEGLLPQILLSRFEQSKFLYDDLVKYEKIYDFKDYIYNLNDRNEERKEIVESPEVLLNRAGYNFYECKREEDIQSFKKYYSKGEELCTFKGNRLNRCYVFFAVKKDVDRIKREDFSNPERQDLYGTSVISIQFTRDKNNTLSIKNRYNHSVNNPDATFSNNLDNIIPGLTNSFEDFYDLNLENFRNNLEIPNYVKANDGKFYKYNLEIDNVYYCPNNIIIDNFEVVRNYQEMERYIVLDYFILDLKKKTIKLFDYNIKDSFTIENIIKIEINKIKETNMKEIIINTSDGLISLKIDKENNIVEYKNNNITEIEDNFLTSNRKLKSIFIPSVIKCGNHFLSKNTELEVLYVPKLKKIGYNFLGNNKKIEIIDMPNVEEVGSVFLAKNEILTRINMPRLKVAGSDFLESNLYLKEISFPELEYINDYFLKSNKIIEKVYLPEVKEIKNNFLSSNENLKILELENVITIKTGFLGFNKTLTVLKCPNLEQVGGYFLDKNNSLTIVCLDKIKKVGNNFLSNINNITFFKFDYLEDIGDNFMRYNNSIEKMVLPSITKIRTSFLEQNKVLNEIILSKKLKSIGSNFLKENLDLEFIDISNVKDIGISFLENNNKLKFLEIPKVEHIGSNFLYNNKVLEKLIISRYPIIYNGFLENNKNIELSKKNLEIIKLYTKLNILNSNIIIKLINNLTPKMKYELNEEEKGRKL